MSKENKTYRLGIDLGSTSLGWCMLELDKQGSPQGIINMGVRIFPDGRNAKDEEPLSVARRGYRAQRRNLDRYLERMRALIKYLMENGFLPEDEDQRSDVFRLNPYELRAKALYTQLTPAEFARALIHLSKKRGFKSSRKDSSDDKTKISEAIDSLKAKLAESGSKTLGEYLWNLYQNVPPEGEHFRRSILFRYKAEADESLIFPTREMVHHEFDEIWASQARFSPIYSEAHRAKIEHIIFYQRPLKRQPKGKCQLIPECERIPKAHPAFQEFRILQNVNNLRYQDVFTNQIYELSPEQRQIVIDELNTKGKVTFSSLRKTLWKKQAEDYRFNYETETVNSWIGNETYVAFHNKKRPEIAKAWDELDLNRQGMLVEALISELEDETVLAEVMALGIPQDIAIAMMQLHLPPDYAHLSLEAINKLLPRMRQGVIYSEACSLAGFSHSGEYNGEIFEGGKLPYYGELLKRETLELNRKIGDPLADKYGKINNPTVHIALNQLRHLINALCKRYGNPAEIVLELAREIKLGQKDKDKLNKQNNKNRKENDRIAEMLREHGITVNRDNILRVRLWEELGKEELDRRCVYSGKQISFSELFGPLFEIEHILPKSRTFDDGTANKTISYYQANRYKGERSPWEAFGNSHDGYDWQGIVTRANYLPDNKKWRFSPDAMDRFKNEEDVLARMLNDTRYMSRVAAKYMYYICGDNNVWTITGKHTALLRKKWGLNTTLGETEDKERTDHRHHAIDAFVIAMTTRSFVKKLANNIKNSRERFLDSLEPPYPAFSHFDFKEAINRITVSYKPDQLNIGTLRDKNQTAGALVKDTVYSYIGPDPEDPKYHIYAKRKPVRELSQSDVDDVFSPELKAELISLRYQHPSKEAFDRAVADWATRRNVKKLKLTLKANPRTMIPVKDKHGRIFKYLASGENLYAEIFIKDPTHPKVKWDIEIVNSYNAHQPGYVPQWKIDHPKAKKVMRLFKNDVVALDTPGGGRELRRVKKMSKNIVFLRELSIATRARKLDDIGEQFTPPKLMELHACKAGVDIMGRYYDPNEQQHGNNA